MNRSRLDAWVTLVANLGVLGGLVFVGLEVRQNTRQLTSEASYAITEGTNQLNEGEYNDPTLVDVLMRGEADYASLDPIDRGRFRAFQFARINLAEYVEDLESEGVYDVNFRYVDFLESQYASKPGLRQFILSIEDIWAGSPRLYARLAGRERG